MSPIQDPALPEGSLVLITGANGFIGSHIVDQLLLAGYRVRGIVRDKQKNSWMGPFFDGKYGKDKFELVEVKDLADVGSLTQTLQGYVHGVIHNSQLNILTPIPAASDVGFSPDPNAVITPTIKRGLAVLKTAATIPTVKRFVYTSSSTAVTLPYPNKEFTIETDTWNEPCIELAWAPPPYEPSRGYIVYAASKTQTEQAMWKFVKEEKPGFVFNTVLPDTTFGPPLSYQNQGHPSTSQFIAKLAKATRPEFENLVHLLPPQYYIDVRDAARLHLLSLLSCSVANERVFAFAHPFNFNDILTILQKNFPEETFVEDWPGLGRDLSVVRGRERSEGLLKSLGREEGFVSLERCVLDNLVGVLCGGEEDGVL